MTITDRINQALRTYLDGGGLGSLSTVQSGIEDTPNAAVTSRIICRNGSANEYKPHLKGIFIVTGEIVVRQSIDTDDAESDFRALCALTKRLAGDERITPSGIMQEDADLHIYNRSWHLDAQGETSGERGFQAVFTWRALARDTLTTN